MTNPNKTLVAALLDRSGSMADFEGPPPRTAGANSSTSSARQPGDCQVTLAQFDTVYEVRLSADR